jgi:hypothetical protein
LLAVLGAVRHHHVARRVGRRDEQLILGRRRTARAGRREAVLGMGLENGRQADDKQRNKQTAHR